MDESQNVIQRRDYLIFVALSMFKCIHGMSPSYISDCITILYNEIAVRDTRASTSSYLLSVPHAPLALFENYFAYRGPVIWNALPEHVRRYNNLHTFKKALRAHVMT